jgi:hypothetical protein
MNRVEIRKKIWGPIFLILFFVPSSVYGFYILFMTDMFADNSVPKVLVPLLLLFCLYYSFKEFLDLVKKKVIVAITNTGLEIFDENLKIFSWGDIRTVELEKRETRLSTIHLLKITSDKYTASILLNQLDIRRKKFYELINEYSNGIAANKKFARWWQDIKV